jgi:hypothetical protein
MQENNFMSGITGGLLLPPFKSGSGLEQNKDFPETWF